MKYLKVFLPMLAIIFAIGLTFGTTAMDSNPSTDYVIIDGVFESIEMELDCGEGDQNCRVQLEPEGPVYLVYDDEDSNTLKEGSGDIIRLYE